MGEHGKGGVYELPNGRFRVSVMLRGRRLWRRARTREQAEARLAALIANVARGHTDGLRAKTRRVRTEDWIVRVLSEGEAAGWDRTYLARVLAAQLSPRRIKRAIFGPCAYCGTWIAATIDHVVPRELGGSDEPENLVSACWSCNSRKGAKTGPEWSIAADRLPFGLPPDAPVSA